ncbi:MAG: glycosyltransferase family 2 protein [Gaiellales bacterium]
MTTEDTPGHPSGTLAALSVDVVVPTFNGWELTRACLDSLLAQTRAHTVVVADNASTDGTPAHVRESFPDARVVELATNHGFAVACNCGARAGDGDVVVLLNNDVVCPPDFLAKLVAPLAERDRLGSVAALLVRPGGQAIDSAGLTADRTMAGFPRLRGLPPADVGARTPVLSGPAGAAGAYRRGAWEEVGGLDEGVFMYGEDLDLALRLRAAGWETTLAADAVAVHLGSASIQHRSSWQRYHGGFARGYLLRRYGVLRSAAAVRALATETIVVAGDAVISRDLAATRGRVAGWRAAAGLSRAAPPREAIDRAISFGESLRLRRGVYAS